MHIWTLVPHAHAQLGASAPCTCTLGRRSPLRMHTWTPVPCAHAHLGPSAPCTSTLCNCICRDGLHYCVEECFRLGKKGQSMPRHMAASNHKHSAITIGVEFFTFVEHRGIFQGRRRGMHAEWMWPNARGCLQPHASE